MTRSNSQVPGYTGWPWSTQKIEGINAKFMSSFFLILLICIHANHRQELIKGKLFKRWKCQLHVASFSSTPLLHAYKHTKTWYKLKKSKEVGRTWRATFKASFLPQPPSTRKESVPSIFAGCSNLQSSACVQTKHKPKLLIIKTRHRAMYSSI